MNDELGSGVYLSDRIRATAGEGQLEEATDCCDDADSISYSGSTIRVEYLQLALLEPIDCYLRLDLLEFGIAG